LYYFFIHFSCKPHINSSSEEYSESSAPSQFDRLPASGCLFLNQQIPEDLQINPIYITSQINGDQQSNPDEDEIVILADSKLRNFVSSSDLQTCNQQKIVALNTQGESFSESYALAGGNARREIAGQLWNAAWNQFKKTGPGKRLITIGLNGKEMIIEIIDGIMSAPERIKLLGRKRVKYSIDTPFLPKKNF
jgi:hypothetical protein